MKEMEGKTAVITGAASGIGFACAKGLLADGAKVLGVDIKTEGLEKLEEAGAMTMVVDVSHEKEINAMIERAITETGRVDVLFNNAGYGIRTKVEDYSQGEFEKMIAVHLFAAMYGMRAAIPQMRKQHYGRIINMISRGGEIATPANTAYSAGKAALWALSRGTAKEVADDDIIINALIPGPTNSSIWGKPMPMLQEPEAVYPTFKMLASLPTGGESGKVFWDKKEYPMFLSTLPDDASLDHWAKK